MAMTIKEIGTVSYYAGASYFEHFGYKLEKQNLY